MEYFERNLLNEIKKWMDRREIIAIKGPRQSGKTTLLEMLKEWLIKEKGVSEENIVMVTFEDIETLEAFEKNPKEFVRRFKGEGRTFFMIDEAQYSKNLGKNLKLLYDTVKDVKFIITGSSSLEILSQTARFLVGRLFSFELYPFNFYEFLNAKDKKLAKVYLEKQKKVKEFILKGKERGFGEDALLNELLTYLNEYVIFGGYPEVIKAKTPEEKKIVLKNIVNTYIEKDVVGYLHITDVIKFKNLLTALAFGIGGLISYEKLASLCNSYFKEIKKLLEILEQTYVVRMLRPFHRNLITELRKNPKVYFFDLGVRNYLINNFNPLERREDVGRLVENFVLNEISPELSINFWRTTAKAEVDFILNEMPIEVKFTEMKTPKITRSFRSFLETYKPERGVVCTKNLWHKTKTMNTNLLFVPAVYL